MFQISWVQSTNANWTGMATYSGNATGNIGVAPKLEMLSGEFGFGQVQLVEDGGVMWVEFVADAAKAYQANSFFNIWVAWSTAYDVRPTIPTSLVEGTTGTVRVVIDDEVVFVQKLGDLADVDLTGVT